jgi:hypothetical protein
MVERFYTRREQGDVTRLRDGVALARLDKRYGAGVVDRLAVDSNNSKSTLYERQAVWCFYFRGVGNSARGILRERPELTYTHLREAMKLADYEEAMDALDAVAFGDQRTGYEHFNDSLPMTTDTFALYIAQRLGKAVPEKPIFDGTGALWQVMSNIRRMINKPDKRVRVKIWSIE